MNYRLDELIMGNLSKAPNEPCIWWNGAWWSSGVIEEMVLDCEESLRGSGFSAGQRLALFIPNSPMFLACCVAIWRLGGTVVPINPQLRSPSLAQYLEGVSVFGAIVGGQFEGLTEALEEAEVPYARVDITQGEVMSIFGGRKDETPDTDSEMAVLFHTAGVSGAAKAVPITHGGILALLESLIEFFPQMNEDDIMLNALPNYHSLGFVVAGIMPLAFGMAQVAMPSLLPPRRAISAMRRANVTIVPVIPMLLSGLLYSERDMKPFSKVRFVFAGGGKISPQLAARTREIFGVDVLEGYGLTEASSVLAVTPDKDSARPGSCGKILSCFEAEVRDSSGEPLPSGEEGVLFIKGEAVACGYYRAPELTAERFQDGWFDTQDVVRLDEDGFITIVARTVDVIFVGGMPVYPTEVENILTQHPLVAGAHVTSVQRGIKGEAIKAYVLPADGASLLPRELFAFCRSRLPNYKVPRSIRILPPVAYQEAMERDRRAR